MADTELFTKQEKRDYIRRVYGQPQQTGVPVRPRPRSHLPSQGAGVAVILGATALVLVVVAVAVTWVIADFDTLNILTFVAVLGIGLALIAYSVSQANRAKRTFIDLRD